MRILITGANGFIGKHTANALQNHAEIFLCGRHTCNMLDTSAVSALVKWFKPTHCLHLAWDTQGDYAESAHNLRWLDAGIHFIRAFYAMGGQRFVGVGTCFEYTLGDQPLSETGTPSLPQTLYGKTKLMLGNFLATHAAKMNRSWAWCRPFYLTGPGEAAHRLVPSACRALLQGNDFYTTAYYRVLDYIDVRDAANALAKVLSSEYCGIINIGSGHGTMVATLLNMISSMIDLNAKIYPSTDNKHDTIIADVNILQHKIKFTPQFSIKETLKACLDDAKGYAYEPN